MEYQIKNNQICVTISDMGAEMQSVKQGNTEYLWHGDAAYWKSRSPLLFPWVGKLTNGSYLLDGRQYAMKNHGFARNLTHTVIDQTEESITFELCDNETTYQIYPYHFILRVTYELKGNRISITYDVMNLSDDTMCFGIGGHPGFCLPFDKGLKFEDYYLEFDRACSPQRIGLTENGFLSGKDEQFPLVDNKRLGLSYGIFEDTIVLRHMADKVTLKSDKGNRKVTLSCPSFPYLGLWHAPDAPYLCIEPWASLPSRQDVIEELRCKSDLIRLGEGEEYTNEWSIEIE